MKAAVLHGVGDIRCERVDTPSAKAGEEVVDIAYAGICGSDVDRVFGKGAYRYPIILGHEFSGYRRRDGRKVTVFPLIPCGKCPMCITGEYASCDSYDYYGSRRDGGFAEQIAVREWNIVEAADGADMAGLAMTEPAAVALHAASLLDIKPGQDILITGAGPVGNLLGQWARLSGAYRIYFADIDRRRLDFIADCGFRSYDGEKTDAAVEGTGASAPLAMCLDAVGPKGCVVLMGNPSGGVGLTQNEYWRILRKQLTLRGTWNSLYKGVRDEWRVAADAIADGRLDVKPLITHTPPLEDCAAAFGLVRARESFVNKVLFKIRD